MGVSLLVVRLLLSPLVLYFSMAYAKGDSGAAPESLTIATSHYGDDTALPRNVDINVPYYPSLGYFSLFSPQFVLRGTAGLHVKRGFLVVSIVNVKKGSI